MSDNCTGLRYCEQISENGCSWCRKADYSDIGFPVSDDSKCDASKGYKLIKDKQHCCEVGFESINGECYMQKPRYSWMNVYWPEIAKQQKPWWGTIGCSGTYGGSTWCQGANIDGYGSTGNVVGIGRYDDSNCFDVTGKLNQTIVTPQNHNICGSNKAWVKCNDKSCPSGWNILSRKVSKNFSQPYWNSGRGAILDIKGIGGSWCPDPQA